MRRIFLLAACTAALPLGVSHAFAQSGSVEVVGGYNFDEAAQEAAGTKDFHSADGHLTFPELKHTPLAIGLFRPCLCRRYRRG